jgi:hypothetical protein
MTKGVREKIAQNMAQSMFWQYYCITFTVEKSSPKFGICTSEIFKVTAQSKQLSDGRKFAQSGHPDPRQTGLL